MKYSLRYESSKVGTFFGSPGILEILSFSSWGKNKLNSLIIIGILARVTTLEIAVSVQS